MEVQAGTGAVAAGLGDTGLPEARQPSLWGFASICVPTHTHTHACPHTPPCACTCMAPRTCTTGISSLGVSGPM